MVAKTIQEPAGDNQIEPPLPLLDCWAQLPDGETVERERYYAGGESVMNRVATADEDFSLIFCPNYVNLLKFS